MAAIDRTGSAPGEFEIINLGGNRTTSLRRLVELLSAALGVEPRIERYDHQPGDVTRTCADITKAGELLGFRPRTPVEEGIPRFVAWLRDADASVSRSTFPLPT
jgi:UDP-glucuronate 4-epimerase